MAGENEIVSEPGRREGLLLKTRNTAFAIWLPLVLILSWEGLVAAGILDALFFPPPSALVQVVAEMIRDGELPRHLQATLSRMFQGFAVGTIAGLGCGLLMGAIPFVRRSLDPLVSALWASPKLTLLPMLIIIFGVGSAPRIILVALGCFIVVALHAVDAVRSVDPAYVELAKNYGADRVAVLHKVYLPAVLPAVFTATRLALGRALTITVSVELINSQEGLGHMIFLAWQSFMTERLYIGIIVTASMGMLFHAVLRYLEDRLIAWRGGGVANA